MSEQAKHNHNPLRVAGLLIAMGVVYGDIGTSPLYVMKAIIEGNGGLANISSDFIVGSISLIIWTLTILTTIKYVVIALDADNHGEGGIFSLYTLVRKNGKHLIILAMIGGAALLADGVLTPAVTVTTAIEGLRGIPAFYNKFGDNQEIIVKITLIILLVLFAIQRLGAQKVGRAFGPVMFAWFTFLGIIGIYNLRLDWTVVRAINPYYAIKLLFSPENKLGLFILGNVFLATTGAEALYSDLGHVGKENIRFSWPYVKICLILNYFGQAAWILSVKDNPFFQKIDDINPFFRMMPPSIMVFGVGFATVAAVIASQALISGSFTLVSEAIKLKLMPKLRILYPGTNIGQMYIPVVNLLLWVLCSLIVITFRTSTHMEAAYGLSITVTMLMTTLLLYYYLEQRGVKKWIARCLILFFGSIESIFFISSLRKFIHGGYVAAFLALLILMIMYIWERGNEIQANSLDTLDLTDYLDQLGELRCDKSVPLFQTNVIFMTGTMEGNRVGEQYLYSILDKRPKRALVYWFLNIEVTDEPYTKEYAVDILGDGLLVKVKLFLGFRMKQSVNVYLREIVQKLMEEDRLPKQPQKYTIFPGREVGDFHFIFVREEISNVTELSKWDKAIMQAKFFIKRYASSPASWFGLEYSEVKYENVPLVIGKQSSIVLNERKYPKE